LKEIDLSEPHHIGVSGSNVKNKKITIFATKNSLKIRQISE
jgi:hypothetical protein